MVRMKSLSTHVSCLRLQSEGELLLLSPPSKWKLSQTCSGHVTTLPLPNSDALAVNVAELTFHLFEKTKKQQVFETMSAQE